MSFIKDLLFGEPAEPGRIEDVRSPEQIQQQQDILNFLTDIVGKGGLPQFEGQTVAPLGGLEEDLLAQIIGFTQGPLPALSAAEGTFTDLAGGTGPQNEQLAQLINRTSGPAGENPILTNLANNPEDLQRAFQQVTDVLTGASADPNDPRLQAVITAATRPIIEQFQDQRDINRNLFTQAGQFVQPGSSSPFELASSRLSVGLANALGDVGADLTFRNLQSERDRQFNLIRMLSQGIEGRQDRNVSLANISSGAFQSEQDRRLAAAEAVVPFERGQLEGLTSALDTAALPRLIEQFGLSQGQAEFGKQQTQLLQILQLLIQGNQPQVVSIPGTPGGGGIAGPILAAGATAFGGPVGAAAAAALGL